MKTPVVYEVWWTGHDDGFAIEADIPERGWRFIGHRLTMDGVEKLIERHARRLKVEPVTEWMMEDDDGDFVQV